MKKKRLPLRAWLLYLAVLSFALTGVTFSSYLTSTSTGDAARTAWFKELRIVESGSGGAGQLIPGVDLEKQATVEFDGSEMACYVFLRVSGEGWALDNDHDTYHYNSLLTCSINPKWTYLTDDKSGAVFYCIVSALDTLKQDVFADNGRITVSDSLKRSDLASLPEGFGLTISATAVQYHGFSEGLSPGYNDADRALNAWNTVNAK